MSPIWAKKIIWSKIINFQEIDVSIIEIKTNWNFRRKETIRKHTKYKYLFNIVDFWYDKKVELSFYSIIFQIQIYDLFTSYTIKISLSFNLDFNILLRLIIYLFCITTHSVKNQLFLYQSLYLCWIVTIHMNNQSKLRAY